MQVIIPLFFFGMVFAWFVKDLYIYVWVLSSKNYVQTYYTMKLNFYFLLLLSRKRYFPITDA